MVKPLAIIDRVDTVLKRHVKHIYGVDATYNPGIWTGESASECLTWMRLLITRYRDGGMVAEAIGENLFFPENRVQMSTMCLESTIVENNPEFTAARHKAVNGSDNA